MAVLENFRTRKMKTKEDDEINTLHVVKIAFDALKVKLNVQKWQEGQLSANSTNRAKTIERILKPTDFRVQISV